MGTTEPKQKLHVHNGYVRIDNTGASGVEIMSRADTSFGFINFSDSKGAYGQIKYSHDEDEMTFNTKGVERMRIKSNGHVKFGRGQAGAKVDLRFDHGTKSPLGYQYDGRLHVNFVPAGQRVSGFPEGVLFILNIGNPQHSAMYFAAAGATTNGCHYCSLMVGSSASFGQGSSCSATYGCLYYAGPGKGMGVKAQSSAVIPHGLLVYVLGNYSS